MLALLLFRFIWPGREFPMDYPNIWAVARLFLPGNDKDIGQARGGKKECPYLLHASVQATFNWIVGPYCPIPNEP